MRTLPLLQTRVHRHDTRPPGTRSSLNLSFCALAHLEARVHRYHARPSRTSCSHSLSLRLPPHPASSNVSPPTRRPPPGTSCSRSLSSRVLPHLCVPKRASTDTTRRPPSRHPLLPQPQLVWASTPLPVQTCVHCTPLAHPAPAAPAASARVCFRPFTSSSACPPTRRWPSRHAPAAPAASSCVCFRTFIHHLLPRLQLARASASSSTCPPTRHSPTRHPHAASADSTCLCLRTFAYSSACPPTRRSPSWHPLLPQIVCAAAPSLLHTCVHQHDTHPHGTSCCRSFSLRVLRHLCSLKVAPAASACV